MNGLARNAPRREFLRDVIRLSALGSLAVVSAWAVRPKSGAQSRGACSESDRCELCPASSGCAWAAGRRIERMARDKAEL